MSVADVLRLSSAVLSMLTAFALAVVLNAELDRLERGVKKIRGGETLLLLFVTFGLLEALAQHVDGGIRLWLLPLALVLILVGCVQLHLDRRKHGAPVAVSSALVRQLREALTAVEMLDPCPNPECARARVELREMAAHLPHEHRRSAP